MSDERHTVIAEFGDIPASFDSPEQVGLILEDVSARFGFDYFAVSLASVNHKREFDLDSYVHNMPQDIVEYWAAMDLTNRNPYVNDANRVVTPISLEVAKRPAAYLEDKRIVPEDLYQKNDIHRLMIFPVQHRDGNRGWFIFAGKQPPLADEQSNRLSMLCLYIFNRIDGLDDRTVTQDPKLTSRQIECLRLSAAGKTTAEIAGITKLSEDTVNYHFVNAIKALNCVTRIQAVAKAIEYDLI